MSDPKRHEDPVENPKVTELVLQDADGDDEQLRALFAYLAKEVNQDAPKRPNNRLRSLVAALTSPLGMTWKSVGVTFGWVAYHLLDYEQRRAKAEEISASAQVKRSQAKVIEVEGDANAEKTLAEAEAIRIESRVKLVRELKELGLDWHAMVTENGEFKVTVSRQPRIDEDFDAGKPR